MREIVLDTETTGLDPNSGHRLVEIACVEIENLIPTGQHFHAYLDPQRSMPEEAYRIHGLSSEFLAGKPLFQDVHAEFLAFIGDSRLIIHNAEFDMKFINFELQRIGKSALLMERVFDTLPFARKKHPGASNSLDALCARYKIDNSRRTKHGALLDAEILAELYTELMGGRQTALTLPTITRKVVKVESPIKRTRSHPLPDRAVPQELEAHAKFQESLGANSFWTLYAKE